MDSAVTADSTSGRRFQYALHHSQGYERTGDIRSSWVDVTTAAGPILLRLGRATKNGGVFELFSRFRRGTENREFI